MLGFANYNNWGRGGDNSGHSGQKSDGPFTTHPPLGLGGPHMPPASLTIEGGCTIHLFFRNLVLYYYDFF